MTFVGSKSTPVEHMLRERQRHTLEKLGHEAPLSRVVLCGEVGLMATASRTGEIKTWRFDASGELLPAITLHNGGSISALALWALGKDRVLLAASMGTLFKAWVGGVAAAARFFGSYPDGTLR